MIKFYLPNKKEDEKIIFLLRRHWFVLFRRMALWGILAAIPLAVIIFFRDIIDFIANDGFFYSLGVLFLSVYYLYVWLFVLNSFVDYFLDVWIVTNERIISIEQKQLFAREMAEQKLVKIQDVTSEMKGMLATFFNFGDIYIQTAGEKERFIFKQVYQPEETARKISSLVEYRQRYERIKEQGYGSL